MNGLRTHFVAKAFNSNHRTVDAGGEEGYYKLVHGVLSRIIQFLGPI